MPQRAFRRISGVLLILFGVSGCGTVTGIPSHGGGKRFAVEQELIAASARAALDSIDLSKLAGRSVRMVFASIGDEGSGNLTGGRLSVDRLVRGDYTSGAPVRTETEGGISRTTIAGQEFQAGIGLLTDGPSLYQSQAFINPRDVDFLSALVASRLILAGAQLKANPASKADILVLVLVDVFGTIRDRTDFLVYNQERLRARTAVELAAVQAENGALVLAPQRGAAEATWDQEFVLWTGPTATRRSLHLLDGLLMPASPVSDRRPVPASAAGIDLSPPPPPHGGSGTPGATRPNLLPKPDTRPRTNPPFN